MLCNMSMYTRSNVREEEEKMKREIKFRAWDSETKEMSYDFLSVGWLRVSIESPYVELMQYTGLKDRNGKEIYEGDIIQFEDMGEEGYEYKEGYDFINRAIVTFENGRFTLDEFMDTNSGVVEELADHEETYSVIQHSEVIGNRWDNPDLLEGGYE